MNKRKHQRFTKRLEAKFIADGESFIGITSNLSENGLFIRTKRGLPPDSIVDIELIMPDGKVSRLQGIVKRTAKGPLLAKNGMGVSLLKRDETYARYVKSLAEGEKSSTEGKTVAEFQIISCPNCQAKNRVLLDKISHEPRCGKCGTPLAV
jgi:ribosomal protein S27E